MPTTPRRSRRDSYSLCALDSLSNSYSANAAGEFLERLGEQQQDHARDETEPYDVEILARHLCDVFEIESSGDAAREQISERHRQKPEPHDLTRESMRHQFRVRTHADRT